MSKEVKNIQLDYATDDDHKQDNSITGVPMVLTHLANSCFKIGHQLSMIILHIHHAIFNVTPHNFSSSVLINRSLSTYCVFSASQHMSC